MDKTDKAMLAVAAAIVIIFLMFSTFLLLDAIKSYKETGYFSVYKQLDVITCRDFRRMNHE